MGLTGEDEQRGVSGIHVKIGEDLEFGKVFVFQEMSFIKDKDGDFFGVGDHVFDEQLNLAKEVSLKMTVLAIESVVDLAIEIEDIDGGERDVKRLERELGELLSKSPERGGFAGSGLTGEQKNAAMIFHVKETALQFFAGLRNKKLIRMNGLFKRES